MQGVCSLCWVASSWFSRSEIPWPWCFKWAWSRCQVQLSSGYCSLMYPENTVTISSAHYQSGLARLVVCWLSWCEDDGPLALTLLSCTSWKQSLVSFSCPPLWRIILPTCVMHPENNIKWSLISFGLGSICFHIVLECLKQKHEEMAPLLVWCNHVVAPEVFSKYISKCQAEVSGLELLHVLHLLRWHQLHFANDPMYSLHSDNWKRLTEAKHAGV